MSTEIAGTRQAETASGAIPWRRWVLFTLGGLAVYAGLYAWSEYLVYRHAEANRFFTIHQAAPQRFDYVIIGASHAMPLGYGDAERALEEASGASVMNISAEGAGILPNRLMLDYFLSRHQATRVLYVIDAFAFYSPQWNEERMDASMLNRAPLDQQIAATLWRYKWARDLLPIYLSGFGKINNPDRFAPDVPEGATKFDRVYTPIAQLDRRRIDFLFPEEATMQKSFPRYREDFEALVAFARGRGMEMIVVRPPTPARYRDNLPDVSAFESAMRDLHESGAIDYHDLSETVVDDPYFYDTDHLNRDGVSRFIDLHLAEVLASRLAE